MKKSRVYNFSAGPGMLPLPVLQRAQAEMLDLSGLGMSVLEISHRSAPFKHVLSDTQNNLRTLLDLPRDYRILFLQGGATLQFSMVPMNLLRDSGRHADYVVAGTWGKKAVTEARREGEVRVLWGGEEEAFIRMPRPDEWQPDPEAAYVHFTSNETIQGLQLQWEPESASAPLVCDMSSDFLSRPIAAEHYGLIYAGAQKNAGPSGVAVVILREDMLERAPSGLHTMLDYGVHAVKDSMHNTPPVFAIYMVNLVTEWLLNEIGGLQKMAAINSEKAALLYRVIDESDGFYSGHAQADSRSHMNVTWRLSDQNLETLFVEQARARGMDNLKGHRLVGGLRASIYNAMPLQGVRALGDFMLQFREEHGK